jgi:hypothetical protein
MVKLDKTFNISPSEILPYKKQEVVKTGSNSIDIKNDYDYTRENLYNLVENGNAALSDLVELARQSEHPRTYEVLSGLIKTIGDTTDKLSVLHEKQIKLNLDDTDNINITNNTLFVGSSTDLLDMLKK